MLAGNSIINGKFNDGLGNIASGSNSETIAVSENTDSYHSSRRRLSGGGGEGSLGGCNGNKAGMIILYVVCMIYLFMGLVRLCVTLHCVVT
jgi:hypothetical protein